jgi:1-phosphofructokinase family hexose kinase
MTLIVCPNLAVDRVLRLERLHAGAMLRAACLQQQAGGKGANVVRALRVLGSDGLLMGFAGGHVGRLIAELADDEGIQLEFVAVDGEARICTVFLEDDGRRTDVFEYGATIASTDERALVESVRSQPAVAGEWAVLSGSAPPGATPGFYAALVATLRESGYRTLVDTAGEQLRAALAEAPELVKVNTAEARLTVSGAGSSHDSESLSHAVEAGAARESHELCRRLVDLGASAAVITRGAEGAVGLAGGVSFSVHTPPVQAINPTGSGDCFAAALVLQMERGLDVLSAVPLAAGAGAANATTAGTAELDRRLAEKLAAAATLHTDRA